MADRLAPLTRRVGRLSAALDPSQASARLLAKVAEPDLQVEVERIRGEAFGSDLRAFRDDPTKVTHRMVTTRRAGHVEMTIELRPARAWQYAQKGAKRHTIGDQGRYLKAAGQHPYRGPVKHPGTRPRRTITKVRERVAGAARGAVLDGVRAVIRETDNG